MNDAFLEPPQDIEMEGNMPSSPEEEYGKRPTSLVLKKKFDFGMRMQLSPFPVQEDDLQVLPKKSDFGILSSLSPSPEPQIDTGTRTSSLMHEGFGTSSENRGEFHIIKSYTNITQVYAGEAQCHLSYIANSPLSRVQLRKLRAWVNRFVYIFIQYVAMAPDQWLLYRRINFQKGQNLQMIQEIHRHLFELHKKQTKANKILEEMIEGL